MNKINIDGFMLTEDRWTYEPKHYEYSGHMYYGSPYETANRCGNCDGANCDRCNKVYSGDEFEFTYSEDELFDWLIEQGYEKDRIVALLYERSKVDYIQFPSNYSLSCDNKEFYKLLHTKDDNIIKLMRDNIINEHGGFVMVYDLIKIINTKLNTKERRTENQIRKYYKEIENEVMYK